MKGKRKVRKKNKINRKKEWKKEYYLKEKQINKRIKHLNRQ